MEIKGLLDFAFADKKELEHILHTRICHILMRAFMINASAYVYKIRLSEKIVNEYITIKSSVDKMKEIP